MDLPSEIDDTPAPLVKVDMSTKPAKVEGEDALRTIEDRVLNKAIRQVEDALSWTDIEAGQTAVPVEWVQECGGHTEAMRRLRAAQGAQKNAREAPVGLKLAKEVFVGVVKARATEKSAPRPLNLFVGRIDFHLPNYERVKVDK